MVKRVSCRVVSSVPLTGRGGASSVKRGDAERSWDHNVDAVRGGFKSPNNSNGYTFRPDAARVPLGESAAGRLLDCLA